ncbi:MAG: hypothetical protein AAF601_11580 [Pseudomonadota bacterium]
MTPKKQQTSRARPCRTSDTSWRWVYRGIFVGLFGVIASVLLRSTVYFFDPRQDQGVHALPRLGVSFGGTVERTAQQSAPRVRVMLPNGKVTGLRTAHIFGALQQETACFALQTGRRTGAWHARAIDPVHCGPTTNSTPLPQQSP